MLPRLVVVAVLVGIVGCADCGTRVVLAIPDPEPHTDQGAWVIRLAGTPDEDYSSENEVPRPPIVARMITYSAKHVRVILMPEVPGKPNAIGTPPPYQWWTIVAFSDPRLQTNAKLSREEGMRRLLAK